MSEERRLIHVGYTNPHQIKYAKKDSGAFYPDIENECHIPLYMLKNHEHRLGHNHNASSAHISQQEAKPTIPQGWRIVEKATCYQLCSGNEVIATLAGPDAEENAVIIATALSQQKAEPKKFDVDTRTLTEEGVVFIAAAEMVVDAWNGVFNYELEQALDYLEAYRDEERYVPPKPSPLQQPVAPAPQDVSVASERKWFISMIDKRIARMAGENDYSDGWRAGLIDLKSIFEASDYDQVIEKMCDAAKDNSVPQDVEEFIDATSIDGYKASSIGEVIDVSKLRDFMAGRALVDVERLTMRWAYKNVSTPDKVKGRVMSEMFWLGVFAMLEASQGGAQ